MTSLDFTECAVCHDAEVALQNYYGTVMCEKCIDVEENTDWDKYEEEKRERIAESNEY